MVVVILLLHCASQKLVKKSLTPGSILVGHSLNHASASILSPLLSPLFKDSRTVWVTHVGFFCLIKPQSLKWLLEAYGWIYDLSSLWAVAVLKIDHKQVTDTGLLFHNSGSHTGPLPTIVNLCKVSQLYSLQVYRLFTLRESLWRCTHFNHHNGCIMFALSSLKPYPLNPKPFCTFLMTCLPVTFICPCDHVHHLAQPCSEFNPKPLSRDHDES
jgi:hypothetical protein